MVRLLVCGLNKRAKVLESKGGLVERGYARQLGLTN
jgi:hypothetical protein